MTQDKRVRAWLLVALGAVIVEQSFALYPEPGIGPHLGWLAISALLLYRVSRGGNTARCWFAGIALFGFIICAASLPQNPHLIGQMLALGVQAAVTIAPPVRSWTQRPTAQTAATATS